MRDVTHLMDWNDVVRLRGWRWAGATAPTPADLDRLIGAWGGEARGSLEPGVVYRELCQPLDVGDPSHAESGGVRPFILLEFAVLTPELATTDRNDRPAEFLDVCEEVSGTFRIDFQRPASEMPDTSVVRFRFFDLPGPPGARQGFLMGWPARAQASGATLCERLISEHHFDAFERSEVQSVAEGDGAASAREGDAIFRIVDQVRHEARRACPAMKAVRFHTFGGPEALRYEDTPTPSPGPGQVLVRVRSVAVNRLDVTMRSGAVRQNFPPWFPDTPGHAFAGVIEAVGEGVTERRSGEEVYGATSPILRRAYAEYIVVSQNVVHPKPRNFSFDEAAACVSVVTTAWAALFGREPLQSGQRILVHGGAGAVGVYAIQLAKHLGAQVVTTASAHNVERLKTIGADLVIDYRTERFEQRSGEVDFVLDSQGGDTRERSWALLKRGGVLASMLRPAPDEHRAAQLGVHAFVVFGHPDIGGVLPEITRRFEDERLARPVISRVLPLEQASLAHTLMEATASAERIVLRAP